MADFGVDKVKEMIAELLGQKAGVGAAGAGVADGVMSLLDTNQNKAIEAGRLRSLMQIDPADTNDFLETDFSKKLAMSDLNEYRTDASKLLVHKAQAAGLTPGTPAFRDFMMNNSSESYDSGINRGLSTPAEREFLMKVFSGEIAVTPEVRQKIDMITGKGTKGYLSPVTTNNNLRSHMENLGFSSGDDSTYVRHLDGFMPAERESMSDVMGRLSRHEQERVKYLLQNMTPEQQQLFLNGMMDGSINAGGYGVQDENWIF